MKLISRFFKKVQLNCLTGGKKQLFVIKVLFYRIPFTYCKFLVKVCNYYRVRFTLKSHLRYRFARRKPWRAAVFLKSFT